MTVIAHNYCTVRNKTQVSTKVSSKQRYIIVSGTLEHNWGEFPSTECRSIGQDAAVVAHKFAIVLSGQAAYDLELLDHRLCGRDGLELRRQIEGGQHLGRPADPRYICYSPAGVRMITVYVKLQLGMHSNHPLNQSPAMQGAEHGYKLRIRTPYMSVSTRPGWRLMTVMPSSLVLLASTAVSAWIGR